MGRDPAESFWWVYRDTRRMTRQGQAAVVQRQRDRLADLVGYAREHSVYYRNRYRELPARVEDPSLLPVTHKAELMAHFDAWVSDPAVTLDTVTAHLADPGRIGELINDRYLVTTTSGTSGTRGIFVLDDRYWAVATALMPVILRRWLTATDLARIIARQGRFAQLIATGGHYVSYAANRRTQRRGRAGGQLRVFSVHTPMDQLVPQLNEFDPALLWGYASVVALLADEQAAGRLQIRPTLVICAAEGLPPAEYDKIADTFGCPVRNLYGSTESGYAAYGCTHGWLHLLPGWTILEPVDDDYQPTPPGVQSHTVLLTNLANRVQPVLRYDLGDSILIRPDRCLCGDPAPAIQVQGRAADVLTFPATNADQESTVQVAPLAFGSLVDRVPAVTTFQIVQTAPTRLRVRLDTTADADPTLVRYRVLREIQGLLASYHLGHVTVDLDSQPPHRAPGGKLRTVLPYRADLNEREP